MIFDLIDLSIVVWNLFQNQYFSGNEENYSRGFYTIFEYSISGSGTNQGMDYVEP